ncbi:hypothetical protein GBA52_002677 [Prunus armeniaca]|nr:hypothetical protein GBA52_002677 [Prunus armeniaca]
MAVTNDSLQQNHHQPNLAFQYLFQAIKSISLILSHTPKPDQEPVECGGEPTTESKAEECV